MSVFIVVFIIKMPNVFQHFEPFYCNIYLDNHDWNDPAISESIKKCAGFEQRLKSKI